MALSAYNVRRLPKSNKAKHIKRDDHYILPHGHILIPPKSILSIKHTQIQAYLNPSIEMYYSEEILAAYDSLVVVDQSSTHHQHNHSNNYKTQDAAIQRRCQRRNRPFPHLGFSHSNSHSSSKRSSSSLDSESRPLSRSRPTTPSVGDHF